MNVLCLGSFVSVFCNRADGVATSKFLQMPIEILKMKKETSVWCCSADPPTSPGSGCAGDTVKLEGHAGRHRQKDRQDSCFLKQACVHREMEYPTFPEGLSLTFVPVCLYRCCNRGFFFPEDYMWCALFFYEMIYIYF